MIIQSIPKSWIKDEIKEQKSKLEKLISANESWKNVQGFNELIEMRKQFIKIAENALFELELKQQNDVLTQ